MLYHGKKVLSVFLAAALLLTLFAVPAFAAQDDESVDIKPIGDTFESTDSYVLKLISYAYFSPFTPLMLYDGEEVYGYSILFGLKNVNTGEVIENAYCTDMPVDAEFVEYHRLNLTDSTYAAEHADKLRAIVLGSYPYLSIEALREASGISELSVCEAITGTQIAIWKTAHGDAIDIIDFLYTADAGYGTAHSEPINTERRNYKNGTDEYKAAVKGRIEALYNYLMSLPERSAISATVSTASFVDRSLSPTVKDNGDGTYDVSVNCKLVNADNGNITLTAYLGEGYYYSQIENVGSGPYSLTIKNVPEKYAFDDVTLSLDGTQYAGDDVFLLQAEGGRYASQSLIAPLGGTLPVHAELKCSPSRALKIYKTADGSPLANIYFEVYYVGSLDDYLNGDLGIGSSPSSADIAKYARTNRLVGTIVTDSNGYGQLDFGTDDGVYLVRELASELVTDRVTFFVCLPDYSRCDADGNPAYTITAMPKNTLRYEKVEIEKDISDIDNEHGSFDVGEEHIWIIQSSIPYGIGSGRKYEVSDTLDSQLTLVGVDKVALAQDSGSFGSSEAVGYEADDEETLPGEEAMVLEADTDYVLTVEKVDGCDSFTVALTEAGIDKIAAVTKKADGYELRIYYTAKINNTADMGTQIPNMAHVVYTNNLNKSYEADSDRPEVHTGGLRLLKVDGQSGRKLKNAVFELYRMATPDEVAAEEYTLVKVGDDNCKMVLVSFYDNLECSGDKVTSLTTGSDGLGYFCGLAYGTYYLLETKSPDGYNELHSAVEVTIDESSHLEDNQVVVANTSGTELPETGGIGTLPFALTGLLLTAVSAWLLLRKKANAQ